MANPLEKETQELEQAIKEAPAEARESIEKPRKKLTVTSEAKKPEPIQEVETEDDHSDEGKKRMVPLPELMTERKKRQAKEEEYSKLQREYADNMRAMNERILTSLPQPPKPKTPEEEPLPDPERNPYEHLLERTRRAEKANQDAAEWRRSLETQATQQRTVQQIGQIVQTAEAQFEAANPDYPTAREHLLAQWKQEAAIAGADENVTQQYINQETMKVIQAAAQFNKNPAEIVYGLAKLRGYAQAESIIPHQETVNTRLTQGPDLDTIQRGQAKARVPASGKTPAAPSIESLLELDDDEFFAATKGSKWNKLVG